MKRTAITRRAPMRRRFRSTKYSRRPRDIDFMLWVKTQPCSVVQEWPDVHAPPTACTGVVEADHPVNGGLSNKGPDRLCIPLCTQHHRERTDHTGSFKTMTKQSGREWRARAIARTQQNYAEEHEDGTATH